ncbi:MAG: hypothetical protein AB2556_15735 [Candidatus Thiodiazotropha sp.]
MDDLIDEILAEIPDPAPGRFTDLDDQVPYPVRLPNDQWVEILNDAKEEFEVDGAAADFSSWRVEEKDPVDIGDIEVADGIHARAGRLALDARMTDKRAARLLDSLPEGGFLLKFLREQQEGEWAVEDKFDPVCGERKKGQAIIEISRDTKPGVLTGIDRVFYQNAYPVSAVAYGLYPIRDPDPANIDPLRDGTLNCVAQRLVKFFEGALRVQGLTPTRRHKIQEWEERVDRGGATVDDVAELEQILKKSIVLMDIAGEDIFNSGKYQSRGADIELICHNSHA